MTLPGGHRNLILACGSKVFDVLMLPVFRLQGEKPVTKRE
jgi:hypothetical protein